MIVLWAHWWQGDFESSWFVRPTTTTTTVVCYLNNYSLALIAQLRATTGISYPKAIGTTRISGTRHTHTNKARQRRKIVHQSPENSKAKNRRSAALNSVRLSSSGRQLLMCISAEVAVSDILQQTFFFLMSGCGFLFKFVQRDFCWKSSTPLTHMASLELNIRAQKSFMSFLLE